MGKKKNPVGPVGQFRVLLLLKKGMEGQLCLSVAEKNY